MAFRPTVEVVVFLTFFALFLSDSINTNLMIYRTCYVTMEFNQHNCSLLGKNSTDPFIQYMEKVVQQKADIISMVKSLVDGFTNAGLCLLVGPWSDRFGRKPLMVLSLIGFTCMAAIMVVFSAIETLSPWFMMACSVPMILTGGMAALLTVLLSYLTDVTTRENRGFRLGVFEGVMGTAVLAGTASSSYVFNATSYVAIYAIGGVMSLLALVYTVFFIPESVQNREETGRFKGVFQVRNFASMFRTGFRNRPQYNRAMILLIVVSFALFYVVMSGDGSVMFLFLREKFSWTLQKYTWYASALSVIWISSNILLVYVINHLLHVTESILILLGFLSLTAGALVAGLASVDWLIYLAAVIKAPSGVISPMARSMMSKLVDPEETGKIFALFNFVQNLLGLVGSPIYTTLYNATISSYPGAFQFLSAAIFASNAAILVAVLVLQKKSSGTTYAPLEAEGAGGECREESIS